MAVASRGVRAGDGRRPDRAVVSAGVRLPVQDRRPRNQPSSHRSSSAGRSAPRRRTTSTAVAGLEQMLWQLQAESPSFSGVDVGGEDFEDRVGRPLARGRLPAPRRRRARRTRRRPSRPLRTAARRPADCEGNVDLSPRRNASRRARTRRRAGAHRARVDVRARTGISLDDHRLALGEPAVVSLLAATRLPADVPTPLPQRPVTRVPLLADSRLVVADAGPERRRPAPAGRPRRSLTFRPPRARRSPSRSPAGRSRARPTRGIGDDRDRAAGPADSGRADRSAPRRDRGRRRRARAARRRAGDDPRRRRPAAADVAARDRLARDARVPAPLPRARDRPRRRGRRPRRARGARRRSSARQPARSSRPISSSR